MKLKLKAKGENQQRVLDYLEANVSDVLGEKINAGEKTMNECWKYITQNARAHAKTGCACIDDMTVYGWAIHFFEEDDIKIEVAAPEEEEEKKPTKPAPKKKESKKQDDCQLSFDDLFGG